MAVKINGADKRIGLALSGGGFRAAAFHLGVMQELHRRGLLTTLDLISCVSGGSIAGGTLVANWQNPNGALETLETYLRTKSIAVASVLGGILDPFETRLDKLAGAYERDLFGRKTLADLSQGPRVYFNATNLSTGNLFFFVAGGGRPEEMGEYELGVSPAKDFAISRAVAASSAFPPVFPPLRIDPGAYPPCAAVEFVTLTDGGIYDNMGINPLLRTKRNPLDFIIVSDGGKPFQIEQRPTESGLVVLKESISIMMEQIRGLEFDRLEHRHLAKKGPKPLWFSIDSPEGEKEPGDSRLAAAVDTNLKKLTGEEMKVLTRQGASLLAARIERYAPELKSAQP